MAKKVLILSSSPRRGGNSDLLCDRFMAGAQQAGHDVEKIFLRDKKINYCTVYFYTLCAQMKTLIDRTCARYTEMGGKEFYFILTAAEESVEMMERTVECFRGFLDCLDDPEERGVVYGVGAWQAGEIEGMPAMDEAYELGRRV